MTFSHSGSSFSVCDIRIQKQMSRSFGKSFPQKIVLPKLRPHCSATCLNTWKAEPQKEKCPFHFQEKFHPRQIKKARDIFLWCCRVKRGSGGTIRAYDLVSSHHARGACALVSLMFEKGSSKVYDYSTGGFAGTMGAWRNWYTRTLQERMDSVLGGSNPLAPTKRNIFGNGRNARRALCARLVSRSKIRFCFRREIP